MGCTYGRGGETRSATTGVRTVPQEGIGLGNTAREGWRACVCMRHLILLKVPFGAGCAQV